MARIVIADDVVPMRLLLRSVLHRAGHDVLEAADGDAALEVLRREQPDVAILDLRMPGLSGLDVCMAVRADHGLAAIGLIILSGDITAEEWQDAAADCWIEKPFRLDELLRAISDLTHDRSRVALPVGGLLAHAGTPLAC